MYDEESIDVSITASKETELGPDSKKHKFTMYTVVVRNHAAHSKVIVKRRYSDFFKLRKELIEFVSWGHCHFCELYEPLIADYHFPRRRLLRSSQHAVVKERMDSLALFLRHLLRCICFKRFHDCDHARANIENAVLKGFLQINFEQLFPSNVKPHILQAMEDKRHQQEIKVAGLRAKTLPAYAETPRKKTTRAPVVDADTCQRCLQKWTHCYCNGDDDGLYPQHQYHERSRASEASDASHCSRCERQWDNCFCCQQVSPAASSACTEY